MAVSAVPEAGTAGRTYRGEALRNVVMPLGGIGTGQIGLAGDGGLRQWEIVNQANHLAAVPDSFFAIHAGEVTRVLQSREVMDLPPLNTPCVNDEVIPDWQRTLLRHVPGMARTTFTGAYPFARIAYEDEALPVTVALEAYSPFVPLDAETSSIPGIVFRFTLRNESAEPVRGAIGAALKNIVGWNGVEPLEGSHHPLFGGNVNEVVRDDAGTSIVMTNPALAPSDPSWGSLALATDATEAVALSAWQRQQDFFAQLRKAPAPHDTTASEYRRSWHERFQPVVGTDATGRSLPSPAGTTWNGGLYVPFDLPPGAQTTVTYVLAWSFPNHYVNYDQPVREFRRELGRSKLWLGNAYSERFPTAQSAGTYLLANEERLREASAAWAGTVLGSSLPGWIAEFLAAQGALIRSPTIFQTDDGKLYGFEGTQGAPTAGATTWRGYSGSCPLNCTHVWNYEQALSRLFPALERTMRETDYDWVQAPEGYIPHRTLLPLFVRQLWDQKIGGPENPALDGMLGTLLKTYREVQQGAGTEWLSAYWPKVRRLYTYIAETWDPDGDGVLAGEQPNTFDIEFWGTNIFIGALWLAAARATEEMAKLVGDEAIAADARERFERGRNNYDARLWGGEYYIQTLEDDEPREQQFLTGCLADQLLGQWWAHQLGLGYILPEEHVRATLRSIVRYNMKRGFHDWDPEERAFADGDDHGLVIISWPRGDRPERPTRYHDEVWTGIEYQVAAHCMHEGLVEEGLQVLEAARRRHDGVKRNPYNDIECGDHYARAMSGWSILEALAGYRYDAATGTLRFRPQSVGACRYPFVAATGWGELRRDAQGRVEIEVRAGEVTVSRLDVAGADGVSLDGAVLAARHDPDTLAFDSPATILAGSILTVA